MPDQDRLPLIAVDVGNSRLKFGRFDSFNGQPLPTPSRTFEVAPDGSLDEAISSLAIDGAETLHWRIASVSRPCSTRLLDWLRERRAVENVRLLASFDLPLTVELDRPDMVGIDRLLGAVAANRLREDGRPAVIVDLGTAITVDAVSAAGAFLGGAILPGIGMSARALHHFTDLLPLLDMTTLAQSPPPLGTSTAAAMQAGLFWGAVGAARRLVELYGEALRADPHVILTGGAAPSVAPLISDSAVYAPHLTLAGIAISVSS